MRTTINSLFTGVQFKVHKNSKDVYTFSSSACNATKFYAWTISKKFGLKTSDFRSFKKVYVVGMEQDRFYNEKQRNTEIFKAFYKGV